ncbi:MAG: sugar phosphate nucleotidyltransferase [Candidatus Firestonebacteria bacterium]
MIGIILAGGKGKRMKSPLPKVLHKICGKPMIYYVLHSMSSLKEIKKIIVVVGYKKDMVKKEVKGAEIAIQKKRLGTADAVKSCRNILKRYNEDILIVCGDIPLITSKTLFCLIKKHKKNKSDLTIITIFVKDPAGYGRIIRDSQKDVVGIIEEKDCNEIQKKIQEINSGIYCFNWQKLNKALSKIKINKLKKEYYLTNVISIFKKKRYKINTFLAKDSSEIMGVDTRERLKEAEKWRKDGKK